MNAAPRASAAGRGVVVVTSGFPRRSETFLLNELRALRDRGLLVAAFSTGVGESGPRHPDAEALVPFVQALPQRTPAEQAEHAAAVLNGRGPTVAGVHGYFAHRPASVAAALAARLKVPHTFGVHALDLRKVDPSELAAKAAGSARVIACNEDAAAELRAASIEPELVPHGVDLVRFRPSRPPAAAGPGSLQVLAVGRLVPKKGFGYLIEAVARARSPMCLRIVGDGPDRPGLQSMIAALGVGSRVELLPARTHADLPAAYAAADVVAVPSVVDRTGDRDGLPNVVLEAMASERPVVAGDVGAVRSAVRDGVTGLLVPPRNSAALAAALDRLAASADLRTAMGRRGRETVEDRFDLARCTERFVATLEAAYA